MRALVTGADGFAGRHLVRHLRTSGDEVFAAAGTHFSSGELEGAAAQRVDIRNGEALIELARNVRPEVIYHLAAIAGTGERERADVAIRVNVIGSLNALRAAASLKSPARLILISSGMVYGQAGPGKALTEDDPLAPSNMYGTSKVAAEAACAALAVHLGVDLVTARPFNHTGPGQTIQYSVPTFAAKIAAVRRGEREVIETGRLDAVRDMSDVRDVVRAYRLLANVVPGIYNVASGRGQTMAEILKRMLELSALRVPIRATNPADDSTSSVFIGDASHLRQVSGWRPQIELDTTLRDVLAEHGAL